MDGDDYRLTDDGLTHEEARRRATVAVNRGLILVLVVLVGLATANALFGPF